MSLAIKKRSLSEAVLNDLLQYNVIEYLKPQEILRLKITASFFNALINDMPQLENIKSELFASLYGMRTSSEINLSEKKFYERFKNKLEIINSLNVKNWFDFSKPDFNYFSLLNNEQVLTKIRENPRRLCVDGETVSLKSYESWRSTTFSQRYGIYSGEPLEKARVSAENLLRITFKEPDSFTLIDLKNMGRRCQRRDQEAVSLSLGLISTAVALQKFKEDLPWYEKVIFKVIRWVSLFFKWVASLFRPRLIELPLRGLISHVIQPIQKFNCAPIQTSSFYNFISTEFIFFSKRELSFNERNIPIEIRAMLNTNRSDLSFAPYVTFYIVHSHSEKTLGSVNVGRVEEDPKQLFFSLGNINRAFRQDPGTGALPIQALLIQVALEIFSREEAETIEAAGFHDAWVYLDYGFQCKNLDRQNKLIDEVTVAKAQGRLFPPVAYGVVPSYASWGDLYLHKTKIDRNLIQESLLGDSKEPILPTFN